MVLNIIELDNLCGHMILTFALFFFCDVVKLPDFARYIES